MIGNPLGAGLDAVGKQTEQVLYQYVPYADVVTVTTELEQERAQRAVYIVEDGGAYSFALFCNFVSFDTNTHTEASDKKNGAADHCLICRSNIYCCLHLN